MSAIGSEPLRSGLAAWSPGRLLRRGRAQAFEWSGASRRARRRLDGSAAVILYYHRVIPESVARRDAVEGGMFVTPETFRRQLGWLQETFRVLPLRDVVEGLVAGKSLPPGACAITFDDGWRDNHEYALPELRRRGVPATVFVVTERVGSDGAFWPDEVSRRLGPLPALEAEALAEQLGATLSSNATDSLLDFLKGVTDDERARLLDVLRARTAPPPEGDRELMDWDEIGDLARAGIDIESHGASHVILTGLGLDGVERELRSARDCLRDRGYGAGDLVAYPSGAFDPRILEIARSVGYRAGVTCELGLARPSVDLLALPRICIHEGMSGSRAEFLFRIPGAAV